MGATGFSAVSGRAYDARLAATIVRIIRWRAATEPKLIEHLLDRPTWALTDELRRLVNEATKLGWLERVFLRVTRHEPNWLRITEDVRGLLVGPRRSAAAAQHASN
jgi:hypothetical protein